MTETILSIVEAQKTELPIRVLSIFETKNIGKRDRLNLLINLDHLLIP